MLELVCATANAHKVDEIAALLRDLGSFTLLARPSDLADIEEDGATMLDNAIIKATAVAEHTQRAALADDSGLEVALLDGAPGVISARYAGVGASDAENNAKLIAGLDGHSEPWRARFVSWTAVAFPDGTVIAADGAVEGVIIRDPRGTNGFGYDPHFVPDDGDGRTFSEMSLAEKQAISHRARALTSLVAALEHQGLR